MSFLRFLMLALLLLSSGIAHAQLNVRVSIKFILDANGDRPTNGGGFGASGINLIDDGVVTTNISYANQLLRDAGRGYQFQLTEIRDVSGWSGFFNISARSVANRDALEATATSNATTRAQFFWRNNAINVYINNTSSGICSFPGSDNVIFAGSSAYDTLIIHEIGHYFNLYHTQEGESYRDADNTACAAADCTCAQWIGGNNDNVDDTITDHECWNRAQIAAATPGASQTQIDNVWLNIMSYHIPADHFTSDQLDRWTDAANDSRNAVVTGRTRFVDRDNNGVESGTSVLPYQTVALGVNNANSGDIVLVRPGNYDETMTITKAVTFRATRGTARIGIP